MTATIRYHGDRLGRQLNDAAARAVQRAGALLMTRARLLASTPAKRTRKRRRHDTSGRGGGKKGSQYTHFTPSNPGRPPALRTGFGLRNIDMEFFRSRLIVRVGVRANAAYMVYLELGTRRAKPRPWLKPALQQALPMIETILRTGLQGGAKGR